MPGGGSCVAVNNRNDVWVTNAGQEIWHWNGSAWEKKDGAAVNISVGVDGTIACCNAQGNIWVRDHVNAPWVQMPGAARQISVWTKNRMVAVNAQDEIWAWSGTRLSQLSTESY